MIKHLYLDVGVNYFTKNPTRIFPHYYYNKFIKKGSAKSSQIYKYKNYDFDIKTDFNDDDNKIVIFIGKKTRCLQATIDVDKETKILSKTIIIQSFGYYNNCSIGKKMERGIGTNGIMFSFIEYIKDNFTNIKKVILTDNAQFQCDRFVKINMSLLYFFKYGSMYYSKKYGFKLYDKNIRKLFIKERNKYWNNRFINNQFLEKFNIFLFSENDKKSFDEILFIKKNLIKYKSISNFLRKYKFKSCVNFNEFINFLVSYFRIKQQIFYHEFILRI